MWLWLLVFLPVCCSPVKPILPLFAICWHFRWRTALNKRATETYLRSLFSLQITQRLLQNWAIYSGKSHRKCVHQTLYCLDVSLKSGVTICSPMFYNSLIPEPEPNGGQFKLTPVKTVNNIFQQLMSSRCSTHPPLWWPLIKSETRMCVCLLCL